MRLTIIAHFDKRATPAGVLRVFIKPCPHCRRNKLKCDCRRKRRENGDSRRIVRIRRQLHFSATNCRRNRRLFASVDSF